MISFPKTCTKPAGTVMISCNSSQIDPNPNIDPRFPEEERGRRSVNGTSEERIANKPRRLGLWHQPHPIKVAWPRGWIDVEGLLRRAWKVARESLASVSRMSSRADAPDCSQPNTAESRDETRRDTQPPWRQSLFSGKKTSLLCFILARLQTLRFVQRSLWDTEFLTQESLASKINVTLKCPFTQTKMNSGQSRRKNKPSEGQKEVCRC